MGFMIGVVLLDQSAERGWIAAGPLALRMMKSLATPIALGSLAALAMKTPLASAIATVLGRRESSFVMMGLLAAGAVLAWPVLVVHLLMTALVVACCLREDQWLSPILSSRPFRHVGLVSYGIYLLNVPAVQVARRITSDTLGVFVLGFAFSIALASITYALVEKPFQRLSRRSRATSALV